jgi:hypothetical protein
MGVTAAIEIVGSVTVGDIATGAAIGALTSAVTGGNVLQGAALGGLGAVGTGLAGDFINSNFPSISGFGQAAGTGIGVGANPSIGNFAGSPGITLADASTGIGTGMTNLGGYLGNVAYGVDTGLAAGGAGASSPFSAIGSTPNIAGGGSSSVGGAPRLTSTPAQSVGGGTSGAGGTGVNILPTQSTTSVGGVAPQVDAVQANVGTMGGSTPVSGMDVSSIPNTTSGGIDYNPASGTTTGTQTAGGVSNDMFGGSAAPSNQASSVIKTPTVDAATGAAPVSSSSGGLIQKGVNAIGKQLASNPIGLGMTALNMMNTPKTSTQLKSVAANAATTQAVGQDLINKAEAGTVTSAQESQIQLWANQQKGALKDYYARAGMGDSSMEASAMANIDQQAASMREQIIQQNLSQGLSALGMSDTSNTNLANAKLQQDNSINQMMMNLAKAMGTSVGQQPATQ